MENWYFLLFIALVPSCNGDILSTNVAKNKGVDTIIGFIFLYNKPANFLYTQILMCKDLTIGGNPGFTGHILLLDRMVVQYRIAPSIFSGFNCLSVP